MPAHKSEMLDRSVELDDIGTALFDQLDARLQRAVDALLQRSERKVATDERARDGATHRFAHDQHFFPRHFE